MLLYLLSTAFYKNNLDLMINFFINLYNLTKLTTILDGQFFAPPLLSSSSKCKCSIVSLFFCPLMHFAILVLFPSAQFYCSHTCTPSFLITHRPDKSIKTILAQVIFPQIALTLDVFMHAYAFLNIHEIIHYILLPKWTRHPPWNRLIMCVKVRCVSIFMCLCFVKMGLVLFIRSFCLL